ncbi:hypothetical protein CO612_00935 [Lysobacteraceae bacterium NML71-0210]|nr:hypothetical protein CO612_00935 [Xanthomonadaceae bacterium NML71-0210]
MFSNRAASPLIEADAWYFLENFIARYLDGTLKPLDFFIQRGSGDHAQPLQKLILLWHTRYFGMDFRIEGIIGILFGGLFCWLMVGKLQPFAKDTTARVLQVILAGLVFSIALSLNSTNIFAWSLVTLTYLIYLLGTLNFFIAYHHARQPSTPWLSTLFFSSLTTGFLLDETGIIFLIAAMLGILVSPPNGIRRALPTLAAILSATLLSRLLMWWVNQRLGISASAFSSDHSITATLLQSDAYKAFAIPLQDSLIHAEHLERIKHGKLFSWLVLALAFGLQIYFWATTLKAFLRKESDFRLALGAFLCLIAYAITFGVVVNRVPEFGWNYLHQPRYVLFYQMTLIAPLLALHYLLEKPLRPAWLKPATATVAAVMICVQMFVSIQAWEMPKYYREYWQNAAYMMEEIQAAPEKVPANCPVHTIAVCDANLERRQQLLNLLKDNRMNIYSNSFQRRNAIYPTQAAASESNRNNQAP